MGCPLANILREDFKPLLKRLRLLKTSSFFEHGRCLRDESNVAQKHGGRAHKG
jgi:hypothetical protein